MRVPRSLLFVPGHRSDRFDKAVATGADRVILDLEDAVAPADKVAARRAVRDWAGAFGRPLVIRVNAPDSPWWADDLAMVAEVPDCDVMVPKSDPDAVAEAADRTGRPVLALVETVAGLMRLRETLHQPGVARVAFGNIDFGLDSGMAGTGSELDHVRAQIVLESRFAGLAAPIDGVTVALSDEDEIARDLDRAKRFGFGGKLCIHPRQVAPTNARFSPSEEELAWAKRMIEAAESSGGAAVAVDGKMVDRPVLERARGILAAAA